MRQNEYLWSKGLLVKCHACDLNAQVVLSPHPQGFSWECRVVCQEPWRTTSESQRIDDYVSCGITEIILTHSHTMTPFDTPGKQAF